MLHGASRKAHIALIAVLVVSGASAAAILTATSGDAKNKHTEVLGEHFTGGGSSGTNSAGGPTGSQQAPAQSTTNTTNASQPGPKVKPSPTASPTPSPAAKDSKKDFTIAGSLADLAPGVSKQLVLTITNPNNFTIQVTSLTVSANDPSSACTGTNIVLGSGTQASNQTKEFTTAVSVTGNGGQNTYNVPVKLSAQAPMACADKRWVLTYTGSATK
jgi:hypothetical protein